jgi:hypothetical protein
MKKIILDTNILLSVIRFRLSLTEEIKKIVGESFEMFVPNPVVHELKKISSKKTQSSKYAKLALKLINSKNIKILSSEEVNADKAIIKSVDNDTIVATDDKELRKKLKTFGTKTIYLRAKKHLAIG